MDKRSNEDEGPRERGGNVSIARSRGERQYWQFSVKDERGAGTRMRQMDRRDGGSCALMLTNVAPFVLASFVQSRVCVYFATELLAPANFCSR